MTYRQWHERMRIGSHAMKAATTSLKTVPATEAKNRLGAILDDAQREPIVISGHGE